MNKFLSKLDKLGFYTKLAIVLIEIELKFMWWTCCLQQRHKQL